jgi:hypothetical protein
MAQQTRFEVLVEELVSLKEQVKRENSKININDVEQIFKNNEIVFNIPENSNSALFEDIDFQEQDGKIVGFSLKFNEENNGKEILN